MEEKTAVFIDGGYISKVLSENYKGIKINYNKLVDAVCSDLNLKRLRTYFYCCLPIIRKNNKDDEYRYSRMQRFILKLKRFPRFEVKLGILQNIGGQFKQKMVDVLMSLDILEMCFDKKVEHIILIAGDSDFVPAIKKAKDKGVIVHLMYHNSSVHNELLDEADELHLISDDLLNKCKIED